MRQLAVCMVVGAAIGAVTALGGSELGSNESPATCVAKPGFSIREQDGKNWLVLPDGKRFFSLGVCCVDMGASRENFTPTNPSYAALQHYPSSNRWAETTVKRLRSWGFTTIGGWSDFRTLRNCRDKGVAFAPVLHIGSTAGAPWWDMWDPKIIGRMEQVARDQILVMRDDARVLGYYSDNEMGWWNAALLKMTLEQAPTSGQRQRLVQLLHDTYENNWDALLKDFDPEGASNWEDLQERGMLYLRPAGKGIETVRRFVGMMAERYYSLVHEIIRKYDGRALILGERYQSFYFPEVARAASNHVDAISSNLNASWNDGTFPRFYLETLHALTSKPVIASEFYMAGRRNRTGNRNSKGVFPVTGNQNDRAEGFTTTLRALLKYPYVIGADWFQYYDEPPFGRYDGEDYNFGLVDIHDRPYRPLTATASRLDLATMKSSALPHGSGASLGVPPAPHDPFAAFQTSTALKHWDRERGYVPPASKIPMADLYVCWNAKAVYLGLYSQDVVEDAFYRDKIVPESDRAEWEIKCSSTYIRARIGAGREPVLQPSGLRLVNLSGVNLNVRNIAAIELPARLFAKERLIAGDTIEFSSALATHARGYRTEWEGRFPLLRH